jgi:hypothetical protein
MTSYKQLNTFDGLVAGADLSSSQYKVVKLDSSGDVVIAGAGEGIGILQNNPLSGQICEVAWIGGGGKGIAGGNIAAGDILKSDANGDLVVADTSDGIIIGLTPDSAVDNDVISVVSLYGNASTKSMILSSSVPDISTASSTAYIVAPIAGDISLIQTAIDGTTATADAILTGNIAGTPITGGAITVANGSVAGDIDSATPTAANTVAAGDLITIVSDGASTNAVKAEVYITIQYV